MSMTVKYKLPKTKNKKTQLKKEASRAAVSRCFLQFLGRQFGII